MSSETYRIRGLVLKRTKLGETDVICTLLAQDGSQVRAVAKGARKPSSSLTSRMELFSACDLLLVRGKSLDIVKEARLVEGNAALRGALELTEAASPMVELLERATVDSLENRQLYPMTMKALSFLPQVPRDQVLTICAAHLLKTLAVLGFKPELTCCVSCGSADVLNEAITSGKQAFFSFFDGGVVCPRCAHEFETVLVDPLMLQWAHTLLYATFEDIARFEVDPRIQMELLRFLQMWIKEHVGSSMKSLVYIFSYGMGVL